MIKAENARSIHEDNFSVIPKKWENKELSEKWEHLFKIKQESNIAIEAKRASKEIGSSLEADIEIKVNKKYFELMENLDLAEYFITSKAKKILTNDDIIKVVVKRANGKNVIDAGKS